MQNDEREPRDEREPPDETTDAEPGDGGAEVGSAEFETAPWPQRDTAAGAGPPVDDASADKAGSPPAEPEPDEQAEPDEQPSPASPPPSDVEAYSPPPDATEASVAAVAAHSVPATEPGESTKCPRCGTENRPGISFCSNCGQRLVAAGAPTTVARPAAPEGTQACPRCGTHNRAGTAFCQNCGANLRTAGEGYVPPAVSGTPAAAVAAEASEQEAVGRAVLGPIVLLIGAVFIAVAWALPFAIGDTSLYEQAFGADGYGVAFWSAYDQAGTLAQQAYFGFAAAAPILVLLLVALAIAGFIRRVPGTFQLAGLIVALAWAIGLVVLFFVVEVFGADGGDLLGILRVLTPGGIIFMLASLIVVIGVLTRLGRG